MRLATVTEILGFFEPEEIRRVCAVGPTTSYNWRKRGAIPERQLIRLSLAHPDKLVVDDEGHPYWLEESEFEPPDWIPFEWWRAYTHVRQRAGLGIEDDKLEAVVEALEQIRETGGDVSLALRYATTRKLSIPIYVERK